MEKDKGKSKGKNKSKSKGNAFERKVSALLDIWWDVPKGTFWRSKISGGSNEPGDITPRVLEVNDKPLHWPFVVECKHYKDIKFLQLLKSSNLKDGGLIQTWWKQLTADYSMYNTTQNNLYRLLIFKGNNTPILVAFCPRDFGENQDLIKASLQISDVFLYKSALYFPIIICTWENFSYQMTKDLFINKEN